MNGGAVAAGRSSHATAVRPHSPSADGAGTAPGRADHRIDLAAAVLGQAEPGGEIGQILAVDLATAAHRQFGSQIDLFGRLGILDVADDLVQRPRRPQLGLDNAAVLRLGLGGVEAVENPPLLVGRDAAVGIGRRDHGADQQQRLGVAEIGFRQAAAQHACQTVSEAAAAGFSCRSAQYAAQCTAHCAAHFAAPCTAAQRAAQHTAKTQPVEDAPQRSARRRSRSLPRWMMARSGRRPAVLIGPVGEIGERGKAGLLQQTRATGRGMGHAVAVAVLALHLFPALLAEEQGHRGGEGRPAAGVTAEPVGHDDAEDFAEVAHRSLPCRLRMTHPGRGGVARTGAVEMGTVPAIETGAPPQEQRQESRDRRSDGPGHHLASVT